MDCVDIIRQGIGRDMSEEEIVSLFEQVKKIKRRVQAKGKAADMAEEVMKAVEKWGERQEVEALAKKRALQLQMQARLRAVDMALNTFKGREADGIAALQVGVRFAAKAPAECGRYGKESDRALCGRFSGGLEPHGEGTLCSVQNRGDGQGRIRRAVLSGQSRRAGIQGAERGAGYRPDYAQMAGAGAPGQEPGWSMDRERAGIYRASES